MFEFFSPTFRLKRTDTYSQKIWSYYGQPTPFSDILWMKGGEVNERRPTGPCGEEEAAPPCDSKCSDRVGADH